MSTCIPSVIRQSSSFKKILMPSKATAKQTLQRLNFVMQQRIREGLQNDAEALRQELKESQAENAKLLQRNSTEVDIADGLRSEKIRLELLSKQWFKRYSDTIIAGKVSLTLRLAST